MKKIFVDCGKNTVCAALLEDEILEELLVEDRQNASIIGNIYAGIVDKILPGQFAFVHIGLPKMAFLHLDDQRETRLFQEDAFSGKKTLRIKQGQTILVQVLKDASGTKGPYVTSCLSMTGQLMVLSFLHEAKQNIGISKKITDNAQRERLKKWAQATLPLEYDVVLRTFAQTKPEECLTKELTELSLVLQQAKTHWQYAKAPSLLYAQKNVVVRLLQELFREDVAQVVLNNKDEMEQAQQFFASYFEGAAQRFVFCNTEKPFV